MSGARKSALALVAVALAGVLAGCTTQTGDEGQPTSDVQVSVPASTPAQTRAVEPADFELWAEAAIAWAQNRLGSRHWYELCLRFAANAFMQKGGPPAEVPEGTWTSALDACNGDEDYDLVLQDYDSWANAPRGVLVFFGETNDNQFGHVGIHLGDGTIVHSYGKVRIDKIEQAEELGEGNLIGSYLGWAYPPERWRPSGSTSTTASADVESHDEDTDFSLELLRNSGLFHERGSGEVCGRTNISTMGTIREVVGRVVTIARDGDSLSAHIGTEVTLYGTRGVIDNPTFDDLKPGVNVQVVFTVLSERPLLVEASFVKFTGGASAKAKKSESSVHITVPTPERENRPVTFRDANLEAVIREAIGKPSGAIHESDLRPLKSLNAADKGISNLSGLEHCVRLTNLYLDKNEISDISPLANLHYLIGVSLGGNRIKDVSPLAAGSVCMMNLWIGNNQISDISPLAKLTRLQWLTLHGNQITDISALANLTLLGSLSLWGNRIVDGSPLANLVWLSDVNLAFNQISDIFALAASGYLSNGAKLNLQGNPLSTKSIDAFIPQLKARGVHVEFTVSGQRSEWSESGTSDAEQPAPPAVAPLLLSPADGVVLDNGRTDRRDEIIWDFDWSDFPGATRYHLYVIGGSATFPVISNRDIKVSSYHHVSRGGYIIDRNRYGWTWRVRAMVGGRWSEWSQARTFDVEPVNAD